MDLGERAIFAYFVAIQPLFSSIKLLGFIVSNGLRNDSCIDFSMSLETFGIFSNRESGKRRIPKR